MKGSPKFDGKICYRKRGTDVNSNSSKSVYFSRTYNDVLYNKRISHYVKYKLLCIIVFVRPVMLDSKDSVIMFDTKSLLCEALS